MLLEGETLAMSDWEILEDLEKLLDAAGETGTANVTVKKKIWFSSHYVIKSPN